MNNDNGGIGHMHRKTRMLLERRKHLTNFEIDQVKRLIYILKGRFLATTNDLRNFTAFGKTLPSKISLDVLIYLFLKKYTPIFR